MKPVFKKLVTVLVTSLVALSVLGMVTVYIAYLYITPRLPNIDALKDVQLQVPLRVYGSAGELIAEFGEMKRTPLQYDEFPSALIKAVLAAEDDRFFEHPGVDYQGLLRAFVHLVRTGEKGQGGSTITMQVARNFFLSREKTYLRKLNEIFLALKIEKELSKEVILSLYLNKIYLGKRAYGFAAAAQVYYGKPINELKLSEITMIAGLPKAPSRYNPIVNPQRALIRRNYVLGRMLELESISQLDYDEAIASEVHARVYGLAVDLEAPYVAEMVRNEMVKRFGASAYTQGYQVYTTVNAEAQHAANLALQNDLLAYDRRHGYRGIEGHVDVDTTEDDFAAWENALINYPSSGNLTSAIVIGLEEQVVWAYTQDARLVYLPWEQLEWARKYIDDNHLGPKFEKAGNILRLGDIIYTAKAKPGCSWLAKKPTVAGALVSLAPYDGAIKALVGGFDFYDSKFNRVVQAKRQPGSSFKPFIYSAAIEKGFTAASIINDAPVVFDAPGLEDTWRPENYSGHFYGPTRLRQALIKSRNLVSIRLLRDIGIGYAIRFARHFGFERKSLPRDLSLALGSGALTPMELATGYAVFANGGYKVKPYLIDHVRASNRKVIMMPGIKTVCVPCVEEEEVKQKAAEERLANLHQEGIKKPEKTQTDEEKQMLQLELEQAKINLENLEKAERIQVLQGPMQQDVARRVISPQTSFLIGTMLRDVIQYGTGRGALVLRRTDLAGKTGTTNDQRDAWFTGFNQDLVSIAWVGFDNPRPLGDRETGARAALPMWIDFMREALRGKPEINLVQPEGIVSVRIDTETGQLAHAESPATMFEYFRVDHVPVKSTDSPVRMPMNGDGSDVPSGDITKDLF
jgi:penicillin-binding protein 1A